MPRNSSPRRWQFSIRIGLLAVTVSAFAVAYWKAYVWEPPTHRIASYEKAPIYFGTTARIGPNQIRIHAVARNDRDGAIRVESGRGEELDVAIENRQTLAECGRWLDAAQIDLRPGGDLIDILEVRIFDHAKRELLSRIDPDYGWHVASPNVLHIYGLRRMLPDTLDVWLRVNSHPADDDVHHLAPTRGASATVQGCTLTIHDLRAGFAGWSSADGFYEVEGDRHPDCALELRWDKAGDQQRYQIAAITRAGDRVVDDFAILMSGQTKSVITFPFPLESIDHFEVRPFGGRHRFFFDGLLLPEVSTGKPFGSPPTGIVEVGGQEVSASLRQFQPLDVRVRTIDGEFGTGSQAASTFMSLIPHPDGPRDRGRKFSLITDVQGLGGLPMTFRFRQSGNPSWLPESQMNRRGGAATSGPSRASSARTYQVPLERIQEIEVSVASAR